MTASLSVRDHLGDGRRTRLEVDVGEEMPSALSADRPSSANGALLISGHLRNL